MQTYLSVVIAIINIVFTFLQQVQRLPKERRKLFSLAVASSLTMLVVAVWVVDLNRRFGTPTTIEEETGDELRGDLRPFATLKRSANDLFEGTKERINALGEAAAVLEATPSDGVAPTSTPTTTMNLTSTATTSAGSTSTATTTMRSDDEAGSR